MSISLLPPIRSWLYAPGNDPKLLERVFATEADAVILDLEDAVPLAEKPRARKMVTETLRGHAGVPGPLVWVRINHPETGLAQGDILAAVRDGLDGIRLPKTEDTETVRRVSGWIAEAEAQAGLPGGSIALVCSLETARGVWNALEIAQADPRLLAMSFGGVDFARDLGIDTAGDGSETLYARSRLVLASRVAGIRPPVESVYPRLQDEAGLEASTRQARALGYFGRAAIHPKQLACINRVFTPAAEEVERARTIVSTATSAEASGSGAVQLADGTFIDAPVVQRAEALLRLAEVLAARRPTRSS